MYDKKKCLMTEIKCFLEIYLVKAANILLQKVSLQNFYRITEKYFGRSIIFSCEFNVSIRTEISRLSRFKIWIQMPEKLSANAQVIVHTSPSVDRVVGWVEGQKKDEF